MNVESALLALKTAGIEGKGAKAARQLLDRDAWPADLEPPTVSGSAFHDPAAEAIGALAEDLVDGRVRADDLPGRMAEVAVLRVGSQPWHELRSAVGHMRENRARTLLVADWDAIRTEITRRGAAAWEQRSAADRELDAAARRLDKAEVTTRREAEYGGAAEAWDSRAEAERELRSLHGLRLVLADDAGMGDRPPVEGWYADRAFYTPPQRRRFMALNT